MQNVCPSSILTLIVTLGLSLKFLVQIFALVNVSLLALVDLTLIVKLLLLLGCTKEKLISLGISASLVLNVLAGLGIKAGK